MSTTVPVTTPSIPHPTGDVEGNTLSLMAVKMNIETLQGTRGIVRATSLHGPTVVNTETGAALRAVQATYP